MRETFKQRNSRFLPAPNDLKQIKLLLQNRVSVADF